MAEGWICSHCVKCTSAKCTQRPFPLSSCELMHCELQCGAIYHRCKNSEHLLFCPNEKIPCLNHVYGCPTQLQRREQSAHLSVCPASVVHCNMEWNRWPVYCSERKAKVPFTKNNYHAKYGQLDVALALRDQRMLNEAMKLPRSTRKAFKNPLTQFPAVPLTSKVSTFDPEHDDNLSSSDEEVDHNAPWERAKHPPGLSSSVCEVLARIGDHRENDQATPNSSPPPILDHDPLKQSHDIPLTSNDSDNSAPCDIPAGQSLSEVGNTSENIPKPPPPPSPPHLLLQEILSLDITQEMIAHYQAKPSSMYTFQCAQSFRRDEYSGHFLNIHDDIHSGVHGWMQQRCPLAQHGCTYSTSRFYPGQKGAKIVYSKLVESFGVKPPSPVLEDNHPLIEEFDEYRKDRDMDGKIKENTPEVLTPINYKGMVQVNGSRLHRESSRPRHEATPPREEDRLTSLPFEVLRRFTCFLDAFSLCNLAVTSKRLREVCCSVLERRGIVIQEWKKMNEEGSTHWKVAYQRWFFSTACTPIYKWGIEDNPPMSEHLKVCQFYHQKPAPNGPFKLHLTGPSLDNPGFYKPLQRMYPEHDYGWAKEYLSYLDELAEEGNAEQETVQ